MKTTKTILALVLAGLCLCGLERSTSLQAATVILSSATNSGYCAKSGSSCEPYTDYASLPSLALLVGKELGPKTNRVFFSFAPNELLRNTNITGVQLRFNVISTTSPYTYLAKFFDFNSSPSDCPSAWNDAGAGKPYGTWNFASGQQVAPLSGDVILDLAAAMNNRQNFSVGMTVDDRDLAKIQDYWSADPPVLIVTYKCIPEAPTWVTATDGVCDQVTVNWNPVAGATGYNIYRDVVGVPIASPSAPPFVDHLNNGATHSYIVQAVNGCGSGASSADTGYAVVAPTAPTGLKASDGTNCSYVHISWNPVAGATSYAITRDGQPVNSTTGTAYDDYPGNTSIHTYAVGAANICGASPNVTDQGWMGITPTAPTGVLASDGTYTGCVLVNWSPVSGATAYQVWRSSVNNSGTATLLPGTVFSSPYFDCSVAPFTNSYYWVKAKTSCDISPFSLGDSGWPSAVPAVPGNITATYGADSNHIDVSWSSVTGASAYLLYRNTNETTVGALNVASVTGTNYSDSTAANCTPYWYWVRATNNSGASGYSTSAAGFAGSIPATPTGLTASDGTYPDKVALTWNSSPAASGYEVWRNTSANLGTASKLAAVSSTSYDDFAALNCTTYWYWIKATNTCTTSGLSAPNSGNAGPEPPSGLSASDGTCSGFVRLTWTPAPGATNYEVWRSPVNDTYSATLLSSNVAGTVYSDGSVPLFTTWYYWLKARTTCGVSGWSDADSGWASEVPGVPGSVTATYGTHPDRIELTWGAVPGASAYLIYRNLANDSSGATNIASVAAPDYTDSALTICTPYYYWVRATNILGAGGYSSSARGLAGTVPGTPTGLTITDGGPTNGLMLSWGSVPEAAGYSVWRALSSDPASRSLWLPYTTALSCTDPTVLVCTRYSYWVTATNACTTSEFSAMAEGLVTAGPGTPTNVTASAGTHSGYVRVCWDPVPGATGYLLLTNSLDDFAAATLLAGNLTNTCYDDYTIPPATTNFYWVGAINDCGASEFSSSSWGYRGPPVTVTIGMVPAGRSITVDETNTITSAQVFEWEPGSCHTLRAPSPQNGQPGTRYLWTSWTGGGGATNLVCPTNNTTYTASFTTQHELTMNVGINGGGTVSPASGWYDETNPLWITATPESGYTFSGWTGTGSGAYTGMNNPAAVALTNSTRQTALFTYTNPCSYSISQSNATSPATGGTGAVTVTTDSPCPWILTNSCNWITILSLPAICPGQDCPQQAGLHCACGPGIVVYGVAPNTTTNSRVCTLLIAGQSLTITQAVACNFSISLSSTNIDADAFTGSFSVSAASIECSWNATTTYNWIHTSSSGNGPGLVTFTVDANPDAASRTGTIAVGGQAFSIAQAGACNYTLSHSGTNISAAAFSGAFSVAAGNGCSWTAEPVGGWIHSTSTGNGDGLATYTVDANPGTSPRSGAIIVRGWAFMVNQAAANPPAAFEKATYNGLFYVTPDTVQESSGSLTVSTTTKGAFSGKLFSAGKSYSFRSQFDITGQGNVQVLRRGQTALTVHLQLAGENTLTGTVGDGSWLAQLHADRCVFSSVNPCAYAGLYTFRIAGSEAPATRPGGDSYGTFKVDARGKATLSGSLADGTKITQSTYVAEDGRLPLFVSLYRGAGVLLGWMEFPIAPAENMGGQAVWIKSLPLPTSARYYALEFNEAVIVDGMKYTPPGSQPVFSFTDGTVTMERGNLAQPLTLPIRLLPNNKIEILAPAERRLRLKFSPSTGKFSGSFLMPASTRSCSFQGILVRQSNGGFGYFLGTDQSGYIRIGPANPF